MPRLLRLALVAIVALLVVPVATVKATGRMPIGFYDDPSFRWANETEIPKNLLAAQRANGSLIHVLADWSQIAPTKPKNPLNGDDPAYHLSDLDALVRTTPRFNFSILMTISGTPKWANGGQTPNHPPTNLQNLTDFAHMLASRYNGRHTGLGAVRRWSVWNEPNLELFLTPQYKGTKIVSAAEYAKLYLAAYNGIKAGNRNALVAAGETSARGHTSPTPGADNVAPATFAHLVSVANPKLPMDAWSEHPYPSNIPPSPTQKVSYPNVSLTNIDRFGADLQKWFGRRIPIWVTEWAEQTRPEFVFGINYAQQAKDVTTAIQLAAQSSYVEMFIWFIFRDSGPQTWFSGLERRNSTQKPSYAAFARAAASVNGDIQTVAPNHTFSVKLDVPFMAYRNIPGSPVGVTYRVFEGSKIVAIAQPRTTIQLDQTVTFPVKFKPVRGITYMMSVDINDRHGQHEKQTVLLQPPPGTAPVTPAKPATKKK